MKTKKTPEEIKAEKEARRIEVAHNRALKSLATKVKNNCKDFGLVAQKQQLEYIKNSPTVTTLKGISRDELISCYERGINDFETGE